MPPTCLLIYCLQRLLLLRQQFLTPCFALSCFCCCCRVKGLAIAICRITICMPLLLSAVFLVAIGCMPIESSSSLIPAVHDNIQAISCTSTPIHIRRPVMEHGLCATS